MKTARDLADCILAMSYPELRAVGLELSEMIEDGIRPKVKTQQEFIDLLCDWAEAQADE